MKKNVSALLAAFLFLQITPNVGFSNKSTSVVKENENKNKNVVVSKDNRCDVMAEAKIKIREVNIWIILSLLIIGFFGSGISLFLKEKIDFIRVITNFLNKK